MFSYLYAFFYILHFCRIFATALYPYLCFSFFYVLHFCRIFATALITCDLFPFLFIPYPPFLIFSSQKGVIRG